MVLAIPRVLLAVVLLHCTASAAPASRPSLVQVSTADSIVIREGYSRNKITITNPALRSSLLGEFSKLDSATWKEEYLIKHGGCGLHVLFTSKSTRLAALVIYPNKVYQAPGGLTHNPQFVVRVAATDLPVFREISSLLPRRKACTNAAPAQLKR